MTSNLLRCCETLWQSLLKRLGCWNLNDSCVLRFQLRQAVFCVTSHKVTTRVGREGWWGSAGVKARTGEQGGQRVATHPPSRFVTLTRLVRPAPCWQWRTVRFLIFLRVSCDRCSCRDAHPPHPCGGWTDCSDGHALSICWNRACFHSFHHPSCLCPSWFVVDLVTPLGRHSLKLISALHHLLHFNLLSSALHPQEGHRFDPALNQQPRSERLLCFAPFMPVILLFRRARLPTSDDNLCRHHPYARTHYGIHTTERDTHTRMGRHSFLPLFSRPGACPAPACHSTPLSLSACVCGVLICLLCIGRSPHLPHCPR